MRALGFLTCALVLFAVHSSPEPHYAAFIPAEIHFPHMERACIHLSGLNQTFQLTVSLHMQAGNLTLLKEEVQPRKLFKCFSFQVPLPDGGSEEVGQLGISIENENEKHEKKQQVLLKSVKSGTFVQTDKAVYKPGQTVKFRMVTLNEDFITDNRPYPLVELQDPNKNRIGQWRDVAPKQGMVALSFPLASEPNKGTYTIKVGEGVLQQFYVEEYVLPKFEVTIELPKTVTIVEDSVQMDICGKYTYGKPVSGKFTASLCRKPMLYRWGWNADVQPPDLCKTLTGQLEKSGCYSEKMDTSFFNMTETSYVMSLEAEASLTEDDTGVILSGKKSTLISSNIATVAFEDTDEYYKSGIPYTGTAKLTSADGSPMADETIYLFIESGDQRVNHSYVTDNSGKASFSLNTSDWASSVNIRGSFVLEQQPWDYRKMLPRYQDSFLWLKPFYSKSKSFLKIHSVQGTLPCEQTQEIQVEYIIQRAELEEDAHEMELNYLVVSKAGIIHEGTKELPVGKVQVLQGIFSIQIPISVQLAPVAKMLVYTIFKDGEVAAATTKFQTTKCFKNQVSLGFSHEEALPGAEVTLKLKSSPNSLCAVRAVDKSTVLMKPEQELTVEKVYNLIRPGHFGGYPYKAEDYEPSPCPDFPVFPGVGAVSPRVMSRRSISRGRRYYMPWWITRDPDVYSLVKEVGIKMITNTNIRQPVKCHSHPMFMQRHHVMAGLPGVPGPGGASGTRLSSVPFNSASEANTLPDPVNKMDQQTRTYFPETWLWDFIPVGESGMADVAVTVPDTITEWVAGSFCVAKVGFGMSQPVSVRAFKPFFVELSLPYSVVRGESFTLKATVFNYLKESIMIQVTLAESEQFKMVAHADVNYRTCLSAEEGKTLFWTVTAVKLGEMNLTVTTEALDTKEVCGNEIAVAPKQGRIDTLIKPILVKPGGVLEEKAHSSLICAEDGKEASEEITLIISDDTLKESERAHLTVLGDIMGSALQNIDKLLAMPYGCGEQNMVKFTPNIYILQYLQKTGQLTEQIKEKAAEFLKSGYQRELTFKHADGSYSAFGDKDEEGNTWLTAFVVKSYSQARPYIFIDEKHINDGVAWLTKQQQESGCFRSVGKLFNNAMKGGIDDDLSLSVYITAALLELGMPLTDITVSQAMSCLKESLSSVTNIYTQALLAYTFTIAGDEEARDKVMAVLYEQAVKSDGQLHWQRKDRPKQENLPFWYQAPSAEVELTSYALMAYLSKKETSKEDIGTSSQIVSWLSKQQNSYGGFSSTQDTVVALQAMAKYAGATYSEKGDVTVTVKSENGFHQEFHVDNKNRLLLQQAPLTEIPGKYTVSATGKGCVFLQATLRYNVPPPKSDATFKLVVATEPESCTEGASSKFGITVTASYSGDREASNMALIEVEMLSGYIPVKSSVRELESKKLVKKVEIKPDKVTIYLDQLHNIPQQYTFLVEQDKEVKNLKPATISVYDYYQKDEHALAEYNSPCSAEHQQKKEDTK